MKLARVAHWGMGFALATMVDLSPARAQIAVPTSAQHKVNAYVSCINRLSARAMQARERYFSWVGKGGPTGKERIIYGTYTIWGAQECAAGVNKVAETEPRDQELEAAAEAFAAEALKLEPLLKAADDYYTQQNYKDDRMAKGRELHPQLVAAWTRFAAADKRLRTTIDAIDEKRSLVELAEYEKAEGRQARYYVKALMLRARALVSASTADKPDLTRITPALAEYEALVAAADTYARENQKSGMGSSFINAAKTFLTSAKSHMRRLRDKVPYSQGDQMLLRTGGASWMVEGSPGRVMRDFNQLVDSFNRGTSF